MDTPCVIIRTDADKARAIRWIEGAPQGTVVEFKRKGGRSADQNALFWSLLTQVAQQKPFHNGVRMSAALWKFVFLDSLGHETQVLPTLDGDRIFPIGLRSSKLSVAEMTDAIELIVSWGSQHGLVFREFPAERAAA